MSDFDRAHQAFLANNYVQAIYLYEQAITTDPTDKRAYWFLGMALLLQGQEAEAQMTWLTAMAEGESSDVEAWTAELAQALEAEAARQYSQGQVSQAWLLRQHLREVYPSDINNLLHIAILALQLERFEPELLQELGILEGLRLPDAQIDESLVFHLLSQLLDQVWPHPLIVEYADVSSRHIADPDVYVDLVSTSALKYAYFYRQAGAAALLTEFCLRLQPDTLSLLVELAAFYQNSRQYEKGIATARRCLELATELPDQVFASYLIIRGLMTAGGYWSEALAMQTEHEVLIQKLLAARPVPLDLVRNARLNVVSFFFPYFRDEARRNRMLQEQLFEISCANMQFHNQSYWEKYQHRHATKRLNADRDRPLRIGYVSHCFYEHSVGWLARWLMQYHDRSQFELYLYFLSYKAMPQDSLQPYYMQLADQARTCGADRIEIAETIFNDDLDILIDLDSVTLDVTCNVLSLKPAPIQVTWLGWDAIGLPTVDYFIADPYVLPDNAQEYYSEKIWRLPQTYLAIDGFEVGIPTLRRDELEIPTEAVIFFSGQRGYKRHGETARLQMQIIKQVPNSYFLIKGLADQAAVQDFFEQLAQEEGVDPGRLRFLPETPLEAMHRANLQIADVVLDTFPYNGATTTMETLWMGIPLVTRVGEQFAARNSYTMLKNAGIEAGIAWTDAEYVEWGVRFGTDPELRQQVHWQLLRSRQTAPLWNAKQFTRDMENAYRQMWHRFVEESHGQESEGDRRNDS